jgi:ketosteroid isomerase-like protein
MLPENLDAVRHSYERWNANDPAWADDVLHDDVVFTPIEDWIEPGPFKGRAAAIEQFRRLREDFGQDHLEAEEINAHGDCVVVKNIWTVRGDHSGIEGEFRNTSVLRFREGLVVEMTFYREHADALRAVGAGEPAADG